MWVRSTIVYIVLSVATTQLHFVKGCLPPPGQLTGPFFNPFPGSPVPQSLKTTESDTSILLAEISIWDPPDDRGAFVPDRRITIDIATGAVAEGWPDGVTPTEVPARLEDPSGGYELRVLFDGIYVALGQGGTNNTLPMLIELQLPKGFFIERPDSEIYFMVDANLAIIFYPGTTECATNSDYYLCSSCSSGVSCSFQENFATVVDLGERRIIRHQNFTSNRGINVLNPGPSNSVRDVWPSLGIVSIGYTDSCGGTGYLAYDKDSGFIIGETESFDPGYLSALAVGEDKEAYIVQEQRVFEDDDLIYVESFQVERISLVTGEVFDSFALNATALWELSTVPFPALVVAPVPESSVPTTAFATAPPTVTLGSVSDSPSDVPSDLPSISTTTSPSDVPSDLPSMNPTGTAGRPSTVPVFTVTGIPALATTDAPTTVSGVPTTTPPPPIPDTLAPFPTVLINWVPPTPLPPTTLAPVPTVLLELSTKQPVVDTSSSQPTTTRTFSSSQPTTTRDIDTSTASPVTPAPTIVPMRTTLAPFPTVLIVWDPPSSSTPPPTAPTTEAPVVAEIQGDNSVPENDTANRTRTPILIVSNFTIRSDSLESSSRYSSPNCYDWTMMSIGVSMLLWLLG